MVARRAHNPKVVGSNPASATTKVLTIPVVKAFFFYITKQNPRFSLKSGVSLFIVKN